MKTVILKTNSSNKPKNVIENKIKSQLRTTLGEKLYNGWDNNRTLYGYHSYNIDDINIEGQRNPKIRLNEFKKFVDFKDKNVLDFGCNVGSMIHHLPEINEGIGFDFDERCIKAANNISEILNHNHNKFMVHDCDKDSYVSLKEKINFNPDIIFILSLGSWIKSWEKLYEMCLTYTNISIILEINNEVEGKPQLDFFIKRGFDTELILDNSLDDCTGNNLRKTYLIKK